jgi:hypothetical protein
MEDECHTIGKLVDLRCIASRYKIDLVQLVSKVSKLGIPRHEFSIEESYFQDLALYENIKDPSAIRLYKRDDAEARLRGLEALIRTRESDLKTSSGKNFTRNDLEQLYAQKAQVFKELSNLR